MARSAIKVWLICLILPSSVLLSVHGQAQARLPAFPGAEGFGASATGGRGGRVIKVTNLKSRGPGSLQDAVNQPGPRIVVFEISGKIHGDVVIRNGDLTIAGQTAPGAGITIRGRLFSRYKEGIDNIIIRHIRIRPLMFNRFSGPGKEYDAIQFSKNRNLILDHITVSWGVDETVDLYSAKDVTVQWSTIEESAMAGHSKGQHNYGLISGPNGSRVSVHHNLFTSHKGRCPAIATGPAEIINNVSFNVKKGFHHHNPARGPFNIIGNYYMRGPASRLIPFSLDYEGGPGPGLAYYFEDNYIDDPDNFVGVVTNPWQIPSQHSSFQKNFRDGRLKASKAFDFTQSESEYFPVATQKSKNIFDLVLDNAGAFPRDVVTLRTIDEVKNRNGTWGVKEPEDLMSGLIPTPAPEDTDNDGMADSWELEHGLNPGNGNDHGNIMPSGYTAIEEYINELAHNLVAASNTASSPDS